MNLKTPRAAALAGVIFALLFGTVIILIHMRMAEGMRDSAAWLRDNHTGIATAAGLMPFVGMSFLWFIGVVRANFGPTEDRFFSTVFLGSGLLFLAMMFVATSVAAALVASNRGVIDMRAHAEVIDFGKMIVLSATKTYALRMAAVFMASAAIIWLRAKVMPKWLAYVTYLVAVAILIVTDFSMWVTMAFPVWVLGVSVLFLLKGPADAQPDQSARTAPQ